MNDDEMFVSMVLSFPCGHCKAKAGEPCRGKGGHKAAWHSLRTQEVQRWAWQQRRNALEATTEVCLCCAGKGRMQKFECPCDGKKPKKEHKHGPIKTCPHGVKFELIWDQVEEE